jgi:hypothetical protein
MRLGKLLLDNSNVDRRSGAGAVDLGVGHCEAGFWLREEGKFGEVEAETKVK